ncbi:hypothetical protein [Metamycoplasma hyosynoviae]|uniref:hypothetical protein n=1 Tax=Metamycoplasma hyosynoviae TaxID=29559 RepID=UPI002358646A|nr:hypothetical protein [Metamycoplasma hyosynoviae]MDC8900136.1 hypothetical protein [Metamycoplasma hyosynoviae]MDC8915477.1 hypothetical protein [Metamycoplasma hyosynoviae]MDC8916220.1 hypothetical protein [Metamycoplasma hyosynoviae]MDC8917699.1 hypothetical protein [Metamycoplasma hyosynoviae]MDC8918999.1 hypothetical protein [Metamycoplasma hyosynoviae]
MKKYLSTILLLPVVATPLVVAAKCGNKKVQVNPTPTPTPTPTPNPTPNPNPTPDPKDPVDPNQEVENQKILNNYAKEIKDQIQLKNSQIELKDALTSDAYSIPSLKEGHKYENLKVEKTSETTVKLSFNIKDTKNNLTSELQEKQFTNFGTQNQPQAPTDIIKGKTLDGITIDKFGDFLDLFALNSQMHTSPSAYKIKAIPSGEVLNKFQFQNLTLISYDDEKSSISFEVEIKIKDETSFKKYSLTCTGFAKHKVFISNTVEAIVDQEKLIEEKTTLKEQKDKPFDYIKNVNVFTSDYKENIDILIYKNNSQYKFTNFSINENQQLNVDLKFLSKSFNKAVSADEQTKEITLVSSFRQQIKFATYNDKDVLNYIFKKMKRKIVNVSESYASADLALFNTTDKVVHKYFEIEKKYEDYFTFDKVKFGSQSIIADDIEGTIVLGFQLEIDKDGQKITSEPAYEKITGFKKITVDTLGKNGYNFKLLNVKTPSELIKKMDEIKTKYQNSPTPDKFEISAEDMTNYLMLQYNEFAIVRVQKDAQEKLTLVLENSISSKFEITLKEGQHLKDNIDLQKMTFTQNGQDVFMFQTIIGKILGANNFVKNGNRVTFNLNYELQFEIVGSNTPLSLQGSISLWFDVV